MRYSLGAGVTMKLPPAFAPTSVGSFPHPRVEPLLDRIFSWLPELPAWPQLPVRDWRESMYVQYSEGLPGAVIDVPGQHIHFDTAQVMAGLEGFYEAVVGEDVERFAISEDYARGLHLFLSHVRAGDPQPARWLKGQVTGPFSFAMTVTDENKRSMAYMPELYEVAVQGMSMKARWMARRLREASAGSDVLIVIDEPYLCSFGSAFVNVAREDVVAAIAGAAAGIHAEGALAGVHCCGNTDWSLVLGTGVDVINFDAYEFWQGLPLYSADLRAFLERDGILSWGLVPTGAADDVSAEALLQLLDERLAAFEQKGMDRRRLLGQALLTPTCGLGTQSPARAERVLDLLCQLSALVRQREGLT